MSSMASGMLFSSQGLLHDSSPCFINIFSLSTAYVSVGTKDTQEDLAENYYYFELADGKIITVVTQLGWFGPNLEALRLSQ